MWLHRWMRKIWQEGNTRQLNQLCKFTLMNCFPEMGKGTSMITKINIIMEVW